MIFSIFQMNKVCDKFHKMFFNLNIYHNIINSPLLRFFNGLCLKKNDSFDSLAITLNLKADGLA